MRIHSDILTARDVHTATALIDSAHAEVTTHGSRKRKGALNVKLAAYDKGTGRRRPNAGWSGGSSEDFSLMWDEWGDVIAALFALDPEAIIGEYLSAEHYRWTTGARFNFGTLTTPHVHRWEYGGLAGAGSYTVSKCKGSKGATCPAITRRMSYGRSFDELEG